MKKFIIHIIAFVTFFFIVNALFNYFYERPVRKAIKENKYSVQLKYSELGNENYDLIFLGSSRGYSSYNPLIIDSILNIRSYNMCTSSQNTIETFYILKHILKKQKPKYIVYEMFLPSFSEKNNYYKILSNAHFFNSVTLKMKMIIKGFGLEGLTNYLIPLYKHNTYVKEDIYNFIYNEKKQHVDRGKWLSGYNYVDDVVDSNQISNFDDMYTLKNINVSSKKIKYFEKIIKLCKRNNIKLICVRAPYPPTRLSQVPKDNISDYFINILAGTNIKYIDFNHLKSNNFKYQDTDFYDYHHMNYTGASKLSKQLAKIFKQKEIFTYNKIY